MAAFGGGQAVLVYWDDLDDKDGDVFVSQHTGDLIVQWDNRQLGAYEFQVLATPIPAVSEWGICLMILLPRTAGTLVLGARRSGQRARTTMP